MDILKNTIWIEENEYCFFSIEEALKYCNLIEGAFYIFLNENKLVKIEHPKSELKQVFNHYQQKGLDKILLTYEDYLSILSSIKKEALKSFETGAKNNAQSIMILDDAYDVLARMLGKFGLRPSTIQMAKDLNQVALKSLELSSPDFWKMLYKLKRKCSEQFLKNLYTSVILHSMISKFSWQSDSIQEKVMLGVMLCDVTLSKVNSKELQIGFADPQKSIDGFRLHPLQAATLVAANKNLHSKEILEIIEQHHEMPDGTGYPRGLNSKKISLLSSLHITARNFIDIIFTAKFNHHEKLEIIEAMKSKFHQDHFDEAIKVLVEVLN